MIQLSQRDETPKLQPPIEKLQKAFYVLSEGLEDGLIKQVIMTPRGKQTRWLDPATRKQSKPPVGRVFPIGQIAGYAGDEFDFSKMEEKARIMSDKQLLFAMRDAEKAKEAMKSMQAGQQENWYADEASVYRNELRRRNTSKVAGVSLSNRDK